MNQIQLSANDKAILSLCGKSKNGSRSTNGTAMKNYFIRWLEELSYNNLEFENLKYSLLQIKINEKKFLASIASCDINRNAKNYTVGVEVAEKWDDAKYKDSWIALFVDIDVLNGGNITRVLVSMNPRENGFLSKNPRSRGLGYYYACTEGKLANVELLDFETFLQIEGAISDV